MTVQIIPLRPVFAETISVNLEGIAWNITYRWNFTDAAWYTDLESTAVNGTILRGLKLVGGSDILNPHAVVELGKMFIVDTEGQFQNPDFDNIGDRYKWLYVPKADVDDYPL